MSLKQALLRAGSMKDDPDKVITLPPVSLDMLEEQIKNAEARLASTKERHERERATVETDLKTARARMVQELERRKLGIETLTDTDLKA